MIESLQQQLKKLQQRVSGLEINAHAHAALRRSNPRMGTYAHGIIDGRQCLSGADLARGARQWGSYKRARIAAVKAIESVGGHVRRNPTHHNRLTVEWTDVPDHAALDECNCGYCWVY